MENRKVNDIASVKKTRKMLWQVAKIMTNCNNLQNHHNWPKYKENERAVCIPFEIWNEKAYKNTSIHASITQSYEYTLLKPGNPTTFQ